MEAVATGMALSDQLIGKGLCCYLLLWPVLLLPPDMTLLFSLMVIVPGTGHKGSSMTWRHLASH